MGAPTIFTEGHINIWPIYGNIMEATDTIVQAVVKKFLERSELGKKKYGVTLDRTDLGPLDWIQHAQDELMDGILYLERLKKEMGTPP